MCCINWLSHSPGYCQGYTHFILVYNNWTGRLVLTSASNGWWCISLIVNGAIVLTERIKHTWFSSIAFNSLQSYWSYWVYPSWSVGIYHLKCTIEWYSRFHNAHSPIHQILFFPDVHSLSVKCGICLLGYYIQFFPKTVSYLQWNIGVEPSCMWSFDPRLLRLSHLLLTFFFWLRATQSIVVLFTREFTFYVMHSWPNLSSALVCLTLVWVDVHMYTLYT